MHRKNILTVKPFGNINLNLVYRVTELLVHLDCPLPHKHELKTMQDRRLHKHTINGQIRVTDRL